MEIWRKIRKRCFLLGVICLIGTFAAGCGNKLSDKFDEEEVKEAAETMINQVNSGELKDVYENTFAPVMRQGIEYEQLQENLDYVFDKLGEFESYEKISIRRHRMRWWCFWPNMRRGRPSIQSRLIRV